MKEEKDIIKFLVSSAVGRKKANYSVKHHFTKRSVSAGRALSREDFALPCVVSRKQKEGCD